MNNLSDGLATFKIIKMYDTDKEGNELRTSGGLIKVNVFLEVVDSRGVKGKIYDMFHEKAPWRIEGICRAIGRADLIASVQQLLVDEFEGLTGKCMLKLDNVYGMKVEKYIFDKPKKVSKKKETMEVSAETQAFFDGGGDSLEDIPF